MVSALCRSCAAKAAAPKMRKTWSRSFFARLLAKDYIAQADPDKGRFRSFLLAGLKRLPVRREGQGGRLRSAAAGQTSNLPSIPMAPRIATVWSRLTNGRRSSSTNVAWATTLLERAARRLQEEYAGCGQGRPVRAIDRVPPGRERNRASYAEVAARLGLSESAVKSAIHRLRQRYHELVREESAQTLANPAELEEEVRHLLRVIGG